MHKTKQIQFRFRKGMNVGQIDAALDPLLADAFIDTGDLDVLLDTSNPQSIVVGRTGAGKSALLLTLEDRCERVIRIEPSALSLQYLSNSTVLPVLTKAGVHLEPFYQLLWRHVFVMELIRHRFQLREDGGAASFLDRLSTALTANRAERAALEYYKEWNPTLWETTDVRVREITNKLQERIGHPVASPPSGRSWLRVRRSRRTRLSVLRRWIGRNVLSTR